MTNPTFPHIDQKTLKTPSVYFSLSQLKHNYHEIVKAFHGVEVFYSVKCNPLPEILKSLHEESAGYEIASSAELEALMKIGVPSDKIMCLHPIKSVKFIHELKVAKVDILAVDSYEEIDKLKEHFPDARLVIRIEVPNEGSGWRLNEKFGIDPYDSVKLMQHAQCAGMKVYGLTMHVGSQCTSVTNWVNALNVCDDVWQDAYKAGIYLSLLSLGGGLPAAYHKKIPHMSQFGRAIHRKLPKLFVNHKPEKITIEPGRAVVASAGQLYTRVFGIAKRAESTWAYIETGTYNGLVEAIETNDKHFYAVSVLDSKSEEKKRYTIGGPTCVALDTPMRDVLLPELHQDDVVIVHNVGAYSATCAAPFNGFPAPEYIFYE